MNQILGGLFSDNSGGLSTVRIVTVGWFLLVAGVWTYVALSTKTVPDIPLGVSGLSATVILAKAYQRTKEFPTT